MPDRVARLPLDPRGYPIPWFVNIDKEGVADFRIIGPGKVERAVKQGVCWICGERLGVNRAFVIGPMCAINRISSEPPSHRDCAEYGARACPFLTRPHMRRRENDLPEVIVPAAGFGVDRNPGATLVWITKDYEIRNAEHGAPGLLFHLGDPLETLWYAEGRAATATEIWTSVRTGLPILFEQARAQGPEAVQDLNEACRRALPLLPRLSAGEGLEAYTAQSS
jgi:hypothetical protein